MLVGNHDTYFKNTNEVNSLELLLEGHHNITCVHHCTEVEFEDVKMLLVPWWCDDNDEHIKNTLTSTNATHIVGHFEIDGFEMSKGSIHQGGTPAKLFKDFEAVETKAETGYYLDKLKNEYLSNRLKSIILQSGSALKEDAAARVLSEMQSKLATLSKFTNNVRDLDIIDLESAENHFLSVKERSAIMGGSPGILTGFQAIDKAYPTGMAPGHLIVAIGWPGRGKTWFTSYLACKAWEQGFKPMIISLEMSPENMRDLS